MEQSPQRINEENEQNRLASKTPEQMESERVAREKLEILMADDFTDFAVRFINEGEYDQMMSQKKFVGREIFRHERNETFKKYLEDSKTKWPYIATVQTDWERSCINMNTSRDLIAFLYQAHETALQNPDDKPMRLSKKSLLYCNFLHSAAASSVLLDGYLYIRLRRPSLPRSNGGNFVTKSTF